MSQAFILKFNLESKKILNQEQDKGIKEEIEKRDKRINGLEDKVDKISGDIQDVITFKSSLSMKGKR